MAAVKQFFKRLMMRGALEYELTRQHNRLALLQHNMLFSLSALPSAAQATTTTQAKSLAITQYTIDGVLKSKAATDNLWNITNSGYNPATGAYTAIAAPVLPGNFQKYLLCLDAAGAASAVECTQSATAAGVLLTTPMPEGVSIVATVLVQNGSAANFVAGTGVLATGGGITVTFSDGCDTGVCPLLGELSGQTGAGTGSALL